MPRASESHFLLSGAHQRHKSSLLTVTTFKLLRNKTKLYTFTQLSARKTSPATEADWSRVCHAQGLPGNSRYKRNAFTCAAKSGFWARVCIMLRI